ncbi:hypothetical protein CQW23_19305 [Capsicum baccatum]|uniref:Uncharacterized protein n=1 Tax=Capsicum baccatum TaxID=33114 RepID=A0A2G2W5E0_CAPBA|nr:hypothetical protein CQW23_19305 [Capsicum baccatum]
MSKMKHLLRKLHIGGGVADPPPHHTPHLTSPPPVIDPSQQQTNRLEQSVSTSSLPPKTTPSSSSALPKPLELNSVSASASESADFNYFEEEFQVQLALAISVSDPDSREDPETAQIKAAQEISLGCSPFENPVEFLSLRYWVRGIVKLELTPMYESDSQNAGIHRGIRGFSSWTGVFTEKTRVISYGGGLRKKMKIEFN